MEGSQADRSSRRHSGPEVRGPGSEGARKSVAHTLDVRARLGGERSEAKVNIIDGEKRGKFTETEQWV